MNSSEFNPYAAPESDERRHALTAFYRIDYRRMTYHELWQISAGVLPFLMLATMKTMRVPSRSLFPAAVPKPTTLDILAHEDAPPEVWDAWGPALQECAENHITLSFLARIPMLGAGLSTYNAHLLSDDELTSATCAYVRVQRGGLDRVAVSYAVSSMLEDGRYALTSGAREPFAGTRQYITQSLPGASVGRLVKAHRAWVPTLGQSVVRMPRATHPDRVLAASQFQFDELLKRKLYTPINQKQYEAIVRQPELPRSVAPPPDNVWDRLIGWVARIALLVSIVCGITAYFAPNVGGLLGGVMLSLLLLLVVSVVARGFRRNRYRKKMRRSETSS